MLKQTNDNFDFIIIGAGIIGLSVARNLIFNNPNAKIAIIDKEKKIGLHGSGRNSGVLHSGIYYPPSSLKAKVCREGAQLLKAYCHQHQLPINQTGKIIVPTKEQDRDIINLLYQRATENGATIRLINKAELKEIEPEAYTATGQALFAPETSVVDSEAILEQLYEELHQNQVQFYLGSPCIEINTKQKWLATPKGTFNYGHLFNTAGLFADKIAIACGLEDRYTMVPFRGTYYELTANSPLKINHLIYPVPDMNMPFLGIHFTKSISGQIYVGPSAIPALGRENYHGIKGMKLSELATTLHCLGKQYITNKQGFRYYANQEIPHIVKSQFLASAQRIVPGLTSNDLRANAKVGIRAQLYDKKQNELVMDFLISKMQNETHVLNVVSPGFTSAFSLAKLITSTKETFSVA